MSAGTIIPQPSRPPSRLSGQLQGATARELAARAWDMITISSYTALRVLAGALVLLYGPPAAGKSTMLARLVDGLAGPVVLLAAEEGLSPSLSERLARLAIRRADLHVLAGGDLDGLVSELRRLRARALGVDSINVVQLLPQELRRVQAAARVPLVAATQQVTKAGEPAGRNAWAHEADVVIRVSDMSWIVEKSRYQPTGLTGGVL